jgi:hypothetical protein
VIEAVVVNRLQYAYKTEDILPRRHFGGRKLQIINNYLHHLIKEIYKR